MRLVIAEKNSVAQDIANVIGATEKKNGYFIGGEYIVTWCVGHLIENAMPEDYSSDFKKWKLNTLPILPNEWKTKVIPRTKERYKVIKELVNDERVNEIICATDSGREGELIFRLVYNQLCCKKPFKRLWISSQTDKAILDGFNNLKDGKDFDCLYKSALARSKADWIVGLNGTRAYTCIYNQMLTVGRVQSPTINLIVNRQIEIDNFESKPYFIIKANTGNLIATKRVDGISESYKLVNECNGKTGYIAKAEKEEKQENPNNLFDLTELQKVADRTLGFSAQQTLDIIQGLYEKKLLTYPRTDSKFISEDMKEGTLSLIGGLLKSKYVPEEIKNLYDTEHIKIDRIINNEKINDHHAIIPTEEVVSRDISLSKSEQEILNLVIYRLLQSVYKPYKYTNTNIVLEIEGNEFEATGKEIIDEGFKAIRFITDKKDTDSNTIPEVNIGDSFDNIEMTSEAKKTKPPKQYTDGTLLSSMENAGRNIDNKELKKAISKGIGTPATRANIIEQIIKNGFIVREKKNLIPTQKAYVLMELLPEEIKSPELTAAWELKLEEVNSGNISDEEFLEDIKKFISDIVKEASNNIKADAVKVVDKEIVGKCPRCKEKSEDNNIYESKVNFYCEKGKECNFTIWKNNKLFENGKKKLTKQIVSEMLKSGMVLVEGMTSPKTGKKYDANIILKDTGKYVNFEMEFINNKKY